MTSSGEIVASSQQWKAQMSAASISSYIRRPQFIYVYDSVVSATMAAIFVAASGPVADLMGWSAAAGIVSGIGAFLISWALFNYALGTAGAPSRSAVTANIAGDGLWAFGSLALLAVHGAQFSGLGQALLVGQALFVFAVFAVKLRGWGALMGQAAPSSHLGKVTIS